MPRTSSRSCGSASGAGGGGSSAPTRRSPRTAEPRRAHIARETRLAVFTRDGGRCTECGSGFELQYDHVIPLALGGGDGVDNLQLLCGDCNRRKGSPFVK